MFEYIEYLNVPTKVAFSLIGMFFIIQIVGELLEFKGKVVPEWVKIRKYFSRRKNEREILHQVPETLNDVKNTINEFMSHYSSDNITMRDNWINSVNARLTDLDNKMNKNNADTLSLLIESKRNTIISFAQAVIDENTPVTREQFTRVFKLYEDYEKIIEENGLTNGEVTIAHRIIKDAYEEHMRNHTFVEDVRGYDI